MAWLLLACSAALIAQCHARPAIRDHHHNPATQAANGTVTPFKAEAPAQPEPTNQPFGHPANQPPVHPGNPPVGQPGNRPPGHPGNPLVGQPANRPPVRHGNPTVGQPGNQSPSQPGNQPLEQVEGQIAAAGFNATDVAWLQLMIAMDERALRLLGLGEERGHEPEVRRLAARMLVSHRTELERLRAVLHRTGLPATNVHAGHDMPGMATPAQLAALESASGLVFDRAFHVRLREHVAQAAHLARSARVSGADPATKDLAAGTERDRAADLLVLEEKPRG